MINSEMEFVLAGGRLAEQAQLESLAHTRTILYRLFGPALGEVIRRDSQLRPLLTPVVSSSGEDVEAVQRLCEVAGLKYPQYDGDQSMEPSVQLASAGSRTAD